MIAKKKIFALSGSTRSQSTNIKLLKYIADLTSAIYDITLFEGLAEIPHFNPDLDTDNPPKQVVAFRNHIAEADGVIICTPEYVFSMPGSLKNALEWMVSTTLFLDKPTGLITASAQGEKGHEQLQLVMQTIGAQFNDETQLLISGIRAKMDNEGNLINKETLEKLTVFLQNFEKMFIFV
jgi:NAD(P)H-dependent FMN reductase